MASVLRHTAALTVLSAAVLSASCDDRTPQISADKKSVPASTTRALGKVEILPLVAGDEPLVDVVKRERANARGRGRELLVYVGAGWCEPCQRFHRAAVAGELDAAFPKLTLLEADHDREETRLTAAGYTSRLIPLFVRPGDDGRATGERIEGSIKGESAVAEITPRLRGLLEAHR